MLPSSSVLFHPIQIGKVLIPNRFMRSATMESLADSNGSPTSQLKNVLIDYAKHKVGLIIPGAVSISMKYRIHPSQSALATDQHIQDWSPIIEQIHSFNSKLIFQLAYGRADPNSFSESEIHHSITTHITAAKLAHRAGADGVQLHGAHGTYLSSLISPSRNHRKDQWGGSLENRLNIIRHIVFGIRSSLPKDFLLSIKLDGQEFNTNLGVKPVIDFVKTFENDFDFFEISSFGGNKSYSIRSNLYRPSLIKDTSEKKGKVNITAAHQLFDGVPFRNLFHLPIAEEIHKQVPKAILSLVGGCREFSQMENVIQSGTAQLISLSRPLIREPNLISKLFDGSANQPECINCGACIIRLEEPMRCYAQ